MPILCDLRSTVVKEFSQVTRVCSKSVKIGIPRTCFRTLVLGQVLDHVIKTSLEKISSIPALDVDTMHYRFCTLSKKGLNAVLSFFVTHYQGPTEASKAGGRTTDFGHIFTIL